MSSANGIVVVFSRPSDFAQEGAWSDWNSSSHLPTTVQDSGALTASWWENTDRPHMAVSPVGFTHVAMYEFADIDNQAAALLEVLDQSSPAAAPRHPAHTVIGIEVLRLADSRWNQPCDVDDDLIGRVIAFVGSNDPAREDEWNSWLDEVHIPDMVNSGAFAHATRWVRTSRARFGLDYLTIYDVTLADLDEAVALSAAAMAPAREQGRLLECHAGGLRAVLHRR